MAFTAVLRTDHVWSDQSGELIDAKLDQGLENVCRSMKECVYLVFQLMCPDNKATICLLKGKTVWNSMDNFLFFQDDDSEDYWEKLLQESDLNHSTVTLLLKSKILAFKAQVN